jgi:hypothetical protein
MKRKLKIKKPVVVKVLKPKQLETVSGGKGGGGGSGGPGIEKQTVGTHCCAGF